MTVTAVPHDPVSRPATSTSVATPLSPRVVALLTLAVLLNYIDRGALSVAAPVLGDEFQLTPAELGVLLSAFFWTYAPAQIAAGWLVHRYDVRVVIGVGVLAWGLATALSGFAAGFASLLVLRLALGLGESMLFPGWQLLMSRHVPESRRGTTNGFVSCGQGLGPMIGTLVGGLVLASAGWRVLFFGLGALTVAWVWPWSRAAREIVPPAPAAIGGAAVPYRQILGKREFWGAALGHFALNYVFYFVLTWLPTFLVKAGGYTLAEMGAIGAAIYGTYAVATASAGALSDRFVRRGASVTRVRKAFLVTAALGAAATTAGCALVPPRDAVWLLGLAGVFFGLSTPMLFAVGSTLAGPRAAGRWAGAQNLAGQIAGIVAPFATGWLVGRTGSFTAAFACASVVATLAVVGWGIVIRRVEPVSWAPAPAPAPAPA